MTREYMVVAALEGTLGIREEVDDLITEDWAVALHRRNELRLKAERGAGYKVPFFGRMVRAAYVLTRTVNTTEWSRCNERTTEIGFETEAPSEGEAQDDQVTEA